MGTEALPIRALNIALLSWSAEVFIVCEQSLPYSCHIAKTTLCSWIDLMSKKPKDRLFKA